eukprot:scaffold40625_cov45-Phaeocystis_antarctica.AAC.1
MSMHVHMHMTMHVHLHGSTGGADPPRPASVGPRLPRRDGRRRVAQHGQSAPLAVPQVGSCASEQFGTPRKRPAHWAPSHRLGCSS